MDNDYLMHWGRLGQKWGVQNGPPYPLSRVQLRTYPKKDQKVSESAQEKYGDNVPAKVEYRLASATDVYAARAYMSDKEIKAYLERVRLENDLKKMAQEEYANSHKLKTYLKDVGKMTVEGSKKYISGKVTGMLKDGIEDAIEEYNKNKA